MTLSKSTCKAILLFLLIQCGFGCSRQNQDTLPGYIEGEYTYLSSSMSGALTTLNVSRGQNVKKNDLLFTLDPEPEQSAMEAAKANVKDLEAQVALAKIQLQRYQNLYTSHATDKSTLDQKQTDYDIKLTQLTSAQKNLTESTWAFNQKTVYAPVSGFVFDIFYRLGEIVGNYSPVLSLLTADNIKVKFYVPEKDLSEIRLGQNILISCDGCKENTKAAISYISPEAEYTPPIIYSQDTRYKLVFLVRASLPSNIAMDFHPGQPVDVTYEP